MELINLSCNKCGAPLEAPPSANFLTCSYCGSRLAVHSSGSAYYTEVLGQIDQKTTQILDKVDTLVEATRQPDQWETCEIVFFRKTDGWFKAECRFVAAAIGVEGRYEARRSAMMAHNVEAVIVPGKGKYFIPRKTAQAQQTLSDIAARLALDGWEPMPQVGDFWYSRQFRRRVRR